MIPSVNSEKVPYLTTNQMIEVDRLMIEVFGIALMQMMENAGRNLADVARSCFLGGNSVGKKVVVLAGTGGNGGGALVCARRLHNWGAQISVFLTKPDDQFTKVPAHQLRILREMQVNIEPAAKVSSVEEPDLIVDGIIGYSLKGAPRGPARDLIRWANAQSVPTLSLDAPSGIDTTTGGVFDPCIKAAATMTLALPKEGLRKPDVKKQVGELYLADISVPPELYAKPSLGISVGPLFTLGDVLRLD